MAKVAGGGKLVGNGGIEGAGDGGRGYVGVAFENTRGGEGAAESS